jgi:glycosyltransferase involved in cell wall biosynthesis
VRKYSERNLRAVIAVSETVREVFAGFGFPEHRIHVVTDGLDIQELTRIEKDEAFRREFGGTALIGGIGKLSVKKNWQLLVRVAAHLAGEGHDLRWLVLGEGPERGRLEELARNLGVGGIVRFPGFHDDAIRLLRNFDVLFHPSLMEGASVTIRSAMVMGVPVVSADAPASLESLGGHGWIVGGDDVAGAAAGILEAASGATMTRDRCSEARAFAVERFSIEKTVQGTIGVYESALA